MTRAAILLGAGALLCGATLFWPAALPHAWLAAAITLLAWPLGCIALILIHALTGGRWGDAARPALLLGVAALPLALLAFVPVGLSLPALYPWLDPAVAAHLANTFYLNLPFFAGRAIAYVVIWLLLALLTLTGGPPRAAPAGLIALALTVNFAVIDLTMSLDPRFSSSVYGMLSGTGMVLFALSVTLLLAIPAAAGRARDDLGKLLLALCLLWAYLDFVQYLVIWSSNLVADASWFRRRVDGLWGWVFGIEAGLHAILPILVLAIPRLRRSDLAVMTLAALLAAGGAVRSWWLVLPEAGRIPGPADVCCMLGLAGLAAGLLALLARRRAALDGPAHA